MLKEMENRHSGWIRVFHWINMFAITMLCLTGFYIHAPLKFRLFSAMDNPRFFHFLLAYVLMVGVVGRAYYAIVTGDWKNIWFSPTKDTGNFPSMMKYYMFLADSHPDYGKYNPGQKMMYTGWFFMALVQVFTGLILLYPNADASIWLAGHLGGYVVIRLIHYIVTWLFVLSVLAHVYLDLSEGIPVLMSMFTGKIPKGFHHTSDDHSASA